MAPPPAKKRQRAIVLSSEDEAEPKAPNRRNGRHTSSRALGSKSKIQRSSLSNIRPLPTRVRAKHSESASISSVGALQSAHHLSSRIKYSDNQNGPKNSNEKSLDAYFSAANGLYPNGNPPSKATTIPEASVEEDFIEDDSFEDELQRLSEFGKLTQPHGGRSNTATKDLANSGSNILPSGSQVFRAVGRGPGKAVSNNGSSSVPNNDNDIGPWAELFGPTNLEEMAVHKRKVADVRDWLQKVFDGRSCKVRITYWRSG